MLPISIRIPNVCHASTAPQVLKGVSLSIAPGESLAIVGGSGSGKSTVLKMVTRLYDATSGDIKVGRAGVGGARA
jgi:ABC-type bacteriocin/lantibiotic exporter with double-glycine peptidase domain